MEGNKQMFDDTAKLLAGLGSRLEMVMNMLPDTPLQRVTLNGMDANACILKDGRVLLEFSKPEDAKKYVDELGLKK